MTIPASLSVDLGLTWWMVMMMMMMMTMMMMVMVMVTMFIKRVLVTLIN
jgi:hypothetical protein